MKRLALSILVALFTTTLAQDYPEVSRANKDIKFLI